MTKQTKEQLLAEYKHVKDWCIMDERAIANPDDAMVLDAMDGSWQEALKAAEAFVPCVVVPMENNEAVEYIHYAA